MVFVGKYICLCTFHVLLLSSSLNLSMNLLPGIAGIGTSVKLVIMLFLLLGSQEGGATLF